ncbi:unnamed protein product [Phytophthora lilii]|uniref:Unnamed protein product n=1 Tax=Phytophthora lilii TaxID=2077276 RepID=A0A9W6TY68_9STRA|nr:unnamed protein product [Phytophthora lilii]
MAKPHGLLAMSDDDELQTANQIRTGRCRDDKLLHGASSGFDPVQTQARPLREEDRGALCFAERELVSITASVETRVLDYLARFILRTSLEAVTGVDIMAEIERKCGTILNVHVPDGTGVFMEWLNMNLQEQNIEARISKYFVDFDRLVEEKGFLGMLGGGVEGKTTDRQKMKLRCRTEGVECRVALAEAVKATGGAQFVFRESASLDLKLTTVADSCHRAEGPEDEFLLGRITFEEIGIDIDHLLEQLASGGNEGGVGAADEDDLPYLELRQRMQMSQRQWKIWWRRQSRMALRKHKWVALGN